MKTTASSLLRRFLFGCFLTFCLIAAGCDRYQLESDSLQAAVSYFYGENAHDGYMLFTWDDTARKEKTRQKRLNLGLDEDWIYWDEQINVINLGDLDYFISYSLTFKNRKTDQLFIKEEKYFSVDEKNWAPMPMIHEYFKTDSVSGEIKSIRVETF